MLNCGLSLFQGLLITARALPFASGLRLVTRSAPRLACLVPTRRFLTETGRALPNGERPEKQGYRLRATEPFLSQEQRKTPPNVFQPESWTGCERATKNRRVNRSLYVEIVLKITLAIAAPKPHICPMTPFLTFRCPTTNQQCTCDVATDAANLAKVWKLTKDIPCRICGTMHQIKIRDAFLDMVLSRELMVTPVAMPRSR